MKHSHQLDERKLLQISYLLYILDTLMSRANDNLNLKNWTIFLTAAKAKEHAH